jgi:hypothetical protein
MDLNPPIYTLLKASSGITDLIGGADSPRIYKSIAPQSTISPYITWRSITNIAEQNLSEAPKVDFVNIQIDCWGKNEEQTEVLAYNTRTALEAANCAVDVINQNRETETKLYRVTLQVNYIFNR